jgi:hypothetical protein
LLFYAGMRAGEQAGTETDSWIAAADHAGERTHAHRLARLRRDEQHAKAARIAVVLSVFLVLLVAALLVGGRAVIDPLLQAAADAREAKRTGDIVYTLPDGTFCRHLSFDNTTAELVEGTIERCAHDLARENSRAMMGFAWGAR